MSLPLADAFARLRDGLPPLPTATELILRPEGERPLAMLRPSGAPPRAFVLDDDRVVELLPAADPRLVMAPLLAEPHRLAAALAPHLGEVSAPQVVAWRPGRRIVLRMTRGDEVLFVKFLDRKTHARAVATLSNLGTPDPPLRFARPIALLPELHGYVAAAAPGRSLRELLADGVNPPWPLVDRAIAALARTPVVDGGACHDFAAARGAAVKLLERAAGVEPALAGMAERVRALAQPAVQPPGFVHGDLHDKQLFLTAEAATLIDLEGVGSGAPRFDLVNLAEHLRLRALQQSGDDDGTAAALLERHGVGGEDRDRWCTVVRARLCAVYALRPRWARLTERLRLETLALLNRLA